MRAAPGWYIDPDDDDQDRYFNGSMWQRERRPHKPGTPAYEGNTMAEADEPRPGFDPHNALAGKTIFLGLVTALSFAGTILVFTVLIERTRQVCTPAVSELTDPVCRTVDAGSAPALIALAVGLVQTALLLVITQMSSALGRTISTVDDLATRR